MSRKKPRRTSSADEPSPAVAAPDLSRMPLAFIGLMVVTVLLPVLASIVQVGGTGGFAGTQALLWMGALIVVTFSLALLGAIRRRSLSLHPTWAILGAVLLAIGAAVAASDASDRYGAVMGTVEVALGVLYFLTCLMVVDSRERIRWLLAALVAGAFVAAASAVVNRALLQNTVLEYFTEYRLDILADHGIRPDSPEEQMFRSRMAGDVFGTFYHPNLMASYVAMGALAALALLVGHARKLFTRQVAGQLKSVAVASALVLVAVLVVMVVAIWMARSRAGAAAALAGAYVMVVLAVVRRRGLRVALIVGPAVIAVVALTVAWHMDLAPEALKSLRFRWDYWQGAWGVVQDHPLRGVGAENFADHYLVHKLPQAPEEIKDPHNLFVRAWSELGLLGLLGVVTLLAAAVRESFRPGRQFPEPRWPMSALWLPMAFSGACILFVAFVFRGSGFSTTAAAGDVLGADDPQTSAMVGAAVEVILSFLLMTIAFVGAIGAGLEDDPALADRSNRWVRCGILGALVAFVLQGQVSFNFSELPTASAAYLLVALAVATSSRREPLTIPLQSRGSRALVAAVVLALVAFYSGALLLPVSKALDELGAARQIARSMTVEGYPGIMTLQYRDALQRADKAMPSWLRWTDPDKLAAESFWHGAIHDYSRAADLRQRAESQDDADLKASLLDDAKQIEKRARVSMGATRALYKRAVKTDPMNVQSWHVLAMVYRTFAEHMPDVDVQADAVAAWRQVVTLYPTRAQFHAEFAECLDRYQRRSEAAAQAREALDLDDRMPDPLRKLSAESRATCLRLAGDSAAGVK